jgi:hypothetical protein
MEGVLFLVACIAIGLVAFWVMRNDAAGPDEQTHGLFAMRSDAPKEKPPAEPRRRGRTIRADRETNAQR